MENASSSVFNVHCVLLMRAWTLLFQWNFSSKFSIATSTTLISRMKQYAQTMNYTLYETNVQQVTTKYLNGLIELIHSNLQTNQESATIEMPKRHFQRTIDYIASREYEGVVTTAAK